MTAFTFIENMAQMIRQISPGAVLVYVGDAAEGPGGKYKPAIWETRCGQMQPVVVGDGAVPIAVGAMWSDVQKASETARTFAARAAECEFCVDSH